VDTARRVVADLIQYGAVKRGGIDATLVQLSPAIAQYAKLDVTSGLLVSEVTKGSRAAKAGLKAGTEGVRYGASRNARMIYLGGDIITEIEGVKITSLADYYSVLESRRPGDTVRVKVLRGKTAETLTVTLDEPEKE
jgi:S1-C subfamily serine protease